MSTKCDRIYFATQQVTIADEGTSNFVAVKGQQTFNFTCDVPLERIFQLGKLSPRVLLEDLPDISISMSKHLDSTPLIYHLATLAATTPTLAGRSEAQCKIGVSIFDATQESATGTPQVAMQFTGAYYSNISYQFGVDGIFTESVDFVNNDIIVSDDDRILNTDEQTRASNIDVAGQFTGDDSDAFINKREHLIFDYTAGTLDVNGAVADADCTILPMEIDGISDSGTNEVGADGPRLSDIQSISVSAAITRNKKQALGSFEPVCQLIQWPVTVTTEIQVMPRTSGIASATAIGIFNTGTDSCGVGNSRNLMNQTIRIATCEGTRIYTGTKNKLRSQNYSGGDAGGSDVTLSYTYETDNDFVVMHENDPHASGATWWTNRVDWLVDS